MRRAIVAFALLIAACAVPQHGNLRVGAPKELDGAAVVVDGVQTSALISDERRDPVGVFVGKILGARQRTAASTICQVPAGTHTIRVTKQGWAPIERTVEVKEPGTLMLICPADLQPAK